MPRCRRAIYRSARPGGCSLRAPWTARRWRCRHGCNAWGPQVLALQIEQGRWKSAHISGALRIDGDLATPQGRLAIEVPRLADVDSLLGTALQGQLAGQLSLTGSGSRSRALVSLSGQDIALGAVRLQTLQVQGSVDEPLRAPRAALQLSAQGTLGGRGHDAVGEA